MPKPTSSYVMALLLLGGCQEKKKPPPPPPTVEVARPLRRPVVDWEDYVGRFESLDTVDLRPRVSGYLTQIAFRDGDAVRRGQLLFVIDPRPYLATLAQNRAQTARAAATLANAQVELERARKLFEAQAGSEQNLESRRVAEQQAAADLEAARANERAAELNVEFTHVRAPLSGRISDRRVARGNLVTADQTVLTSIVNLDPIRFGFDASEAQYLQRQRQRAETGPQVAHRQGDPVEIRLGDETNYRWKGRLEFIDNQIEPGSGIIRGRAVLPNPDRLLTPGMFGHMRMAASRPYQGLLVPDEVVQADQNRQIVMIVGKDGKVREQPVEPGPLVDGLRVVRSGLKPDDVVVIAGLSKAKPGAKVRLKQGRIGARQDSAPPTYEAAPPSAGAGATR